MSSPLLSSLRLLRMSLPHLSPLAPSRSLRIPPIPPEIENTEHPAKHKLQPQPKVPHMFGTMMVKTPKGTKQVYRMQGEDTTHNKLMLKQYGVIAVSGGAMNHAHFEMCRGYVNRHMNKVSARVTPRPF